MTPLLGHELGCTGFAGSSPKEWGDGVTSRTLGVFPTLFGIIVLIAALLGLGRLQFERTIQGLIADLETVTGSESGHRFSAQDLDDLPAPVTRYFETVLTDGQSLVDTVRLEQRGDLRLGGADGEWHGFTASQYASRDPPGFVWDARVTLAPLVSARVLDCYVGGEGRLRAKVAGAIPVASAGPDRKMDQAELLRHLAEGVWYPTALLPGAGVEWEAIDDSTARASLTDGDSTATLTFHFDGDNLVERVTGSRYRENDNEEAPWVGYFDDYAERNGRLIPLSGEVAWDLPQRETSYWRGRIERIDHRDSSLDR